MATARQVDDTPLEGTPVNGTPVNGTPVNGTPVDGTPVDGTPVDGTPVDGRDGSIGTAAGLRRATGDHKHEYLMVRTSRLFGLVRSTRLVPVAWMRSAAAGARRVTLDASRAEVAGCPVVRDDARIEADVTETLYGTGGFFRVPEIHASVSAGVVHLRGHASSDRVKRAAVSNALAVPGVLDVQDGTFEDGALILAVAQALTKEPETRAAHLLVTSRMGAIRLNGTVPSAAARELATTLAMAIPGVAHVFNEAEVGAARRA